IPAPATAIELQRMSTASERTLEEFFPELVGHGRHHPLEATREQAGHHDQRQDAEYHEGHGPECSSDPAERLQTPFDQDKEEHGEHRDRDDADRKLPAGEAVPWRSEC